ncbi:MAG TPA: MlaD family protein, partial [Thermoanaerobaculia bacterium]|nr:MlaD family protein [Thermoanaerobaculia bacterium]
MTSAAKLGVFMIVVLAIVAFFILKIEDLNFGRDKYRELTAYFDNAAGLEDGSTVRIAGVRKGRVMDVTAEPSGRAKVVMEIEDDVPLHTDASARVASMGLLGEKYIEIDPGSPNLPVDNREVVVLRGTEPASFDDVTNQVAAIAADVKAITGSLRTVMAGQKGEQRLEDIVENVHTITGQVRDLIAANRSNVDATMANARALSAHLRTEIPRLAASIDRVANAVGGTVTENREDVRHIVDNLRGLSRDLRTTADNLNDITGRVRSGEGSVGKLFYSDEAHDKLTSALTSVESGVTELKNTLGRATRIGLDVGMKADYYAGLNRDDDGDDVPADGFSGNARGEVMVRLTPNPERNRFYNIQLADDPQGKRRDKITEETVTDPATGRSTTTITRTTRFDRDFLLSAQAGWQLNEFGVRLGIFDNTGGAGVDYNWNDRLRVTGEAFDFGKKRDDNPHVRLFTEYILRKEKPRTPMIFFSTGIDNP